MTQSSGWEPYFPPELVPRHHLVFLSVNIVNSALKIAKLQGVTTVRQYYCGKGIYVYSHEGLVYCAETILSQLKMLGSPLKFYLYSPYIQ